jgi:hypothetical protein
MAVADGCDSVLVIYAVTNGWLDQAVRALVAQYQDSGVVFSFEPLRDARSAEPIAARLKEHGIDPAVAPSTMLPLELVRQQLGGQRVLCIRSTDQRDFETALIAEGFPVSCLDLFEEEPVGSGKNSGLVAHISASSGQFGWLLYAWAGLRSLPSEVKRKFAKGAYEAPTTAKVVTMLRRKVVAKRVAEGF